jgi:hypothetical protein
VKHFRTPQSRRSEPRPTATAIIITRNEHRIHNEIGTAVRNGEITLDIRPVHPRDHHKRFHARDENPQTLAVRTKVGASAVCHVHVTDVRGPATPMRLGMVSFEDARHCGYRTTLDFKRAWLARHDAAWVSRQEEEIDDDAIDARFARHAHKPVWAIRFTAAAASGERYLAARADELYVENTAQALRGEPAALSAADFKLHVTDRADMTSAQWRALERGTRDAELESLSLGQQLDKLVRENRDAGFSVTREVRVIEKRLQALEQQLRRAA